MAELHDHSYVQFNFLVNFDSGNIEEPEAGFQECGGLDMSRTSVESFERDENEDSIGMECGLNQATHVTLKRGVVRSLNLSRWLDDIRNGKKKAARTVLIQLQNEDHTAVVGRWKLQGARIIKHVSGPMNATGTDVALEELTLSYDRLEIE